MGFTMDVDTNRSVKMEVVSFEGNESIVKGTLIGVVQIKILLKMIQRETGWRG